MSYFRRKESGQCRMKERSSQTGRRLYADEDFGVELKFASRMIGRSLRADCSVSRMQLRQHGFKTIFIMPSGRLCRTGVFWPLATLICRDPARHSFLAIIGC